MTTDKNIDCDEIYENLRSDISRMNRACQSMYDASITALIDERRPFTADNARAWHKAAMKIHSRALEMRDLADSVLEICHRMEDVAGLMQRAADAGMCGSGDGGS